MTSNNRLFRTIVLSIVALGAFAVPAPLYAQGQNCPAGAPPEDSNIPQELSTFNSGVNQRWPGAAGQIETLNNFPPFQKVEPCGSDGDTVCGLNLASCEQLTFNAQLKQLTMSQVSALSFGNMTVQKFNPKEIAQHTAKGPDAGKITDGVFAQEGATWNDPSYTVVLTSGVSSTQFQNALLQSALTIDLGSPIEICTTTSQCGGATMQADRHSFALDYSMDGTNWLNYGTLPYKDSDGLHTRSVTIASSLGGQTVTAQYIRVYGQDDKDDNSDYSIAEVELKDSDGNIISIKKLAIGPRPYQITDGVVAPAGNDTWNDPTYAAVLRSVGVANALVIDLGGLVNVCGSTTCGPTVQADRHPFQIDFSPDGINWVPYSQVPEVSGDGLITRTSSQIAANAKLQSFTARYVRLYGLPADDDNYSISEVQLQNTASPNQVVSKGKLTWGPEPLETDGEVAPEGTAFNDPDFATLLPACAPFPFTTPFNPNTVCAKGSQTGVTGALIIDLGQVFSLASLQVQADNHKFQIDYRANPTDSWQSLWPVPSVSGSGLLTRPLQSLTGEQARYLMVYGTDTTSNDINYSVSSAKVYTTIAKTPCAYASFADAAQQAAACSYDGTMTTDITAPGGELSTSFIIASAEAHYRCSGAFGGFDVTIATIDDNTSCTGNLVLPTTADVGQFCSSTCADGTTPASALTFAGIAADPPTTGGPDFTLTTLSCDLGELETGLTDLVEDTASTAVGEFFVQLAASPLTTPSGQQPPLIPSGQCQAPPQPPANTQLSGRATDVGKASNAGKVSLSGRVSAPGAPPLNTLTLDLQRVLYEPDGVKELVRTKGTGVPAVPLTLLPQKGSRANHAVYATAPGVKPEFRVMVRNAPGGQLEFSLDVHGAHMPTLPTCTEGPSSSVMLGTGFSLRTDGGPPIEVHALQEWQCEGKDRLTTP